MILGFFLALFVLQVNTGRQKEITWGFATKTSMLLVQGAESNPSFINVSNPKICSFIQKRKKNNQINGFYESECLISEFLKEDFMKIIKFEMDGKEHEVPIQIFDYELSNIILLKGSSKYDKFYYECLLDQIRSYLRYLVESILNQPKKYKNIIKEFKKYGKNQVEKSFVDNILPKLNILLTDKKKRCRNKSTNEDMENITECVEEFMDKNFTENDIRGLIEKYIKFGDLVIKTNDDKIYEILVARCNDFLQNIAEFMGNKLKLNSFIREKFYINIEIIKGLRVKATDPDNVKLFNASGLRIFLNLKEHIVRDEKSPDEYFIIPNEIIEKNNINYVHLGQNHDILEIKHF